ncbi:MAG: HIT domain-containing protein [candidate division WOR-3 bacterium]
MKRIWAPWRSVYIEAISTKPAKTKKCFLCANNSLSNFLVAKGTHAFVILNRYPYNPGHLLVAPYRHVSSIEQLSDIEICEIFKLITKSVKALKASFQPDGFNIGLNLGKAGGAGLAGHLHFHIVPRWIGDTNFMAVLADTKVINEELKKTQKKLKGLF